jgi:peptidoglycan biosynthesis protein MviN/MurJ (putative lipid II flippase)
VVAAFYAMDDTATPIRIGVVGFLVGLVLKSVGFVMFGVLGLAAGASAYYLLNLAIMAMVLEGRVNGIAAAADRKS